MAFGTDYIYAYEIEVKLDPVFFFTILIEVLVGIAAISRVLLLYARLFPKLNVLVKSYLSVLIPHLINCLNIGLRSFILLVTRENSVNSPECKTQAFFVITGMIAQIGGAAFMAFLTYSMVIGKPRSLLFVFLGNVAIWGFMAILVGAVLFNAFGTNKGLMCEVDPVTIKFVNILPLLFVGVFGMGLMARFYYLTYKHIKEQEAGLAGSSHSRVSASQVVFRRGLTLVGTFYGCWAVMLTTSIFKVIHFYLHPAFEMVTWYFCMAQPIIDSYVIYRVLRKVAAKDEKKEGPSKDNTSSSLGGGQRTSKVTPMGASDNKVSTTTGGRLSMHSLRVGEVSEAQGS